MYCVLWQRDLPQGLVWVSLQLVNLLQVAKRTRQYPLIPNGVVGRIKWRAAEAVITGTAETRATTLPVGTERLSGWGTSPPKPIMETDVCGGGEQAACYGGRCGGGEQAACPDEVYGLIVGRGEAARTAAVVHSRQTVTPENETAWILRRPPVYISGRPAIVKVIVGY